MPELKPTILELIEVVREFERNKSLKMGDTIMFRRPRPFMPEPIIVKAWNRRTPILDWIIPVTITPELIARVKMSKEYARMSEVSLRTGGSHGSSQNGESHTR